MEDIFKKCVCEYSKKLGFYLILCKFELIFNDLTYDFKLSRKYNLQPFYYLRKNLMSKSEHFTIEGHKFPHIPELTLTLITNSNNITYEYYLKQTKSMLEWRVNEKVARNPMLIYSFDRTVSHPLVGEYSNVDPLE